MSFPPRSDFITFDVNAFEQALVTPFSPDEVLDMRRSSLSHAIKRLVLMELRWFGEPRGKMTLTSRQFCETTSNIGDQILLLASNIPQGPDQMALNLSASEAYQMAFDESEDQEDQEDKALYGAKYLNSMSLGVLDSGKLIDREWAESRAEDILDAVEFLEKHYPQLGLQNQVIAEVAIKSGDLILDAIQQQPPSENN